jgi:arginyl-tRNA--protein-N-Asp/Glu arginylyltransferase
MQIIFNHSFGHQEQGEFFHCGVELIEVQPEEYDAALAMGFLLQLDNNQPRWYQCRSTRVRTANTNYTQIAAARLLEAPYPYVEMDHIYTAYCYYKKFKKYFEVNQHLHLDKFMGYYQDNNLVAWAKLRHYTPRALETALFVWDYSLPASRLGSLSLQHEIAWAKESGYEFVYLGPGYETSSLYKSEIEGFEWWNGDVWSTNVEEYRRLCKRDSKIKKVSDLYGV